MNCKPNDLARVIGDSEYAGKIVLVLYLAKNKGNLPDGYLYDNEGVRERWVIEFPHPVKVPLSNGETRMTRYGCGGDSKLTPLRGDELDNAKILFAPMETCAA